MENLDHAVSVMRMKELADLAGIHLQHLSRHYRSRPDTEVRRTTTQVTGVKPGAVETLLRKRGFEKIYRPGVYITNSQCGGVSKTTTTINMAYAFARMSDRATFPILILDVDSQASCTLQLLGECERELPVLVDYVEGRVKDIRDLAIPVGENIFLIPSSLDNAYLQGAVATPKKVKELGSRILKDLFRAFAIDTRLKIFIDAPPALSPITHTFLIGSNSLSEEFDKALCIPIRPDRFGIRGCEIALREFEEMLSTYNEKRNINIVPFLSFFQKNTNSVNAMKRAIASEIIARYELSGIVIRKSDEIAKKMDKNRHIYSQAEYKTTPIGQDYQDLMLSVMGWSK